MNDREIIRRLVEEALDLGRDADEVCSDHPQHLPAVRAQLARLHRLDGEISVIFPRDDAQASAKDVEQSHDKMPEIRGYLLEEVIGRGGMGVVYRARQARLNRSVAIKMLLLGTYAGEIDTARFKREAEVLAGVDHTNIVKVFDVGEADGRPFFTMEYLAGGTLARRLARKPQPTVETARTVAVLARAVDAAHKKGVVHRDLKPGNILIGDDGILKIADFGLARRFDDQAAMTVQGMMVGTPSYMAPEQARGNGSIVGPSADVYALGAILYEMLTGRPPFEAETPTETLRQVLSEDPAPPSRMNAALPRDIETIVMKCLRKEPHRRYAGALALAEDLDRFLAGEPISARPTSLPERVVKWAKRRPAKATSIAAVSILLSCLMGGAVWIESRRAAVESAVLDDLDEVRRFASLSQWDKARTALDRARARIGGGADEALENSIRKIARDLDFVDRLETIRANRLVIYEDGDWDARAEARTADSAYERAMSDFFSRRSLGDAERTADAIATSDINSALVAAFDDWSASCDHDRDPARHKWILKVLQIADGGRSEWKDRVRSSHTWTDRAALEHLAATAPIDEYSTTFIAVLAERIESLGGRSLPLLRRIQMRRPDDFWANAAIGFALRYTDPTEAVRFFQAALAIRPDSAPAASNLGTMLAMRGDLESGIDLLRRSTRRAPTWAQPLLNLGNALTVAKRSEEAVDVYREALSIVPDSATGRSNLGVALLHLRRVEEAEIELRQALRIDPRSAATLNHLGVLLRRTRRFDESIAALEEAVRLEPRSVAIIANLGDSLQTRGRKVEAVAQYRRALEIRPELPEALNGLGNISLQERRLDEAEAYFARAASLEPDSAVYVNSLGGVLHQRGRLDAAVVKYRRAIELDPNFASALTNLGNVFGDMCRWDDALECYEKAARLDPDSIQNAAAIAQVHRLCARFTESKASLEAAMKGLPSDHPWAKNLAADLQLVDRLIVLDARIPAILAGNDRPTDLGEDLEIAHILGRRDRFVRATRRYEAIFAANPEIKSEPRRRAAFRAAGFAVSAAFGLDRESPATEKERREFLGAARQWLRCEIDGLEDLLDSTVERDRTTLGRLLQQWFDDPRLLPVRDDDRLNDLDPVERDAFRALWRRAGDFLEETFGVR